MARFDHLVGGIPKDMEIVARDIETFSDSEVALFTNKIMHRILLKYGLKKLPDDRKWLQQSNKKMLTAMVLAHRDSLLGANANVTGSDIGVDIPTPASTPPVGRGIFHPDQLQRDFDKMERGTFVETIREGWPVLYELTEAVQAKTGVNLLGLLTAALEVLKDCPERSELVVRSIVFHPVGFIGRRFRIVMRREVAAVFQHEVPDAVRESIHDAVIAELQELTKHPPRMFALFDEISWNADEAKRARADYERDIAESLEQVKAEAGVPS